MSIALVQRVMFSKILQVYLFEIYSRHIVKEYTAANYRYISEVLQSTNKKLETGHFLFIVLLHLIVAMNSETSFI